MSHSRSPGHSGHRSPTPDWSSVNRDCAWQGLDLMPRCPFSSYLPHCYPWPGGSLTLCLPSQLLVVGLRPLELISSKQQKNTSQPLMSIHCWLQCPRVSVGGDGAPQLDGAFVVFPGCSRYHKLCSKALMDCLGYDQ